MSDNEVGSRNSARCMMTSEDSEAEDEDHTGQTQRIQFLYLTLMRVATREARRGIQHGTLSGS